MLGTVILAHGVQKLFGWFGGYGFEGTMAFFTETIGLPWVIGLAIILFESIGALAIILGLAIRPLVLFSLFLAVGIIISVHAQHGFYMNWAGNQAGEGIEFFLLWIGMALSLLITGGGQYSVDRLYFSQPEGRH